LGQVEVGQRTPLAAEIKSGVEADEKVIVHPANELRMALAWNHKAQAPRN